MIKIILLIGAIVLLAVLLHQYFSPYQICVRGMEERGSRNAAFYCARAIGGN